MKLTKEQIGEMVRFSIVGVLITVIHYAVYWLQMGLLNFFLWLGWSAEWAPVGVYAISIPVNFLLVRFVFKKLK